MKKYVVFPIVLVLFIITRLLAGLAVSSSSYLLIAGFLFLGMLITLGGCELFTNGIEGLGGRFKLSHAATGSLLAAIGTALPETVIPIIALLSGKTGHREGIAIGAILGAPFMLGTLAMFFLGLTVLARGRFKRKKAELVPNVKALKFEAGYIIFAMALILAASLAGSRTADYIAAFLLLGAYVLFFILTLKHKPQEHETYDEDFHFGLYLGFPTRRRWLAFQAAVGLLFIVAGANLFVEYISVLALKSGASPLMLSFLIVPFATEFPEKFNSISWTLKGKDTLALANVTGAMVFQSSIPVSIGLLFTNWAIGRMEMTGIFMIILMILIIRITVSARKEIPFWVLLAGGVFYLAYLAQVIKPGMIF
ncbi:MAG: hypothetical protein M0Z61_16505 [Nitrospiraceae bacterium]|nr:hypothetical protein [Nitrospiraceae bacterium]